MTLAESMTASVRRVSFKRRLSVSLVVHLYGSLNPHRDDGGWPCSSGGAVVVSVGVLCPECGSGLRVEVPDDCEGDAVCEYCGDRVGRVLRVVPPRASVPRALGNYEWVPNSIGVSWWLQLGGIARGVVTRSPEGWSWSAFDAKAACGSGTLGDCARALDAAVRGAGGRSK